MYHRRGTSLGESETTSAPKHGLRICSNIRDARDANIDDLHQEYKVEKLDVLRNRQLLQLMYKLSRQGEHLVAPTRVLRANNKLKLKTARPIKDIYKKSPAYRGMKFWDRCHHTRHHLESREKFTAALTAAELAPLAD